MCFVLSFIGATVFAVVGFFVLAFAERLDGGLKRFGRVLAVWVFLIALYIPCLAGYVTFSGNCPIEKLWSLLDAKVTSEE